MSIRKMAFIRVITILGFMFSTYTDGIQTTTVKPTTDMGHKYQVIRGDISIMDLVSLINSYLWFAIGFFCFVFMIWNWYKLIMANWDSKSTDSAKKWLLWSVVWIAVCLLAYIIVNLAVRLFA